MKKAEAQERLAALKRDGEVWLTLPDPNTERPRRVLVRATPPTEGDLALVVHKQQLILLVKMSSARRFSSLLGGDVYLDDACVFGTVVENHARVQP